MFEVVIDGNFWTGIDSFECNEWLNDNNIQYKLWEENLTEVFHYIFDAEEDAMAFKLRWM